MDCEEIIQRYLDTRRATLKAITIAHYRWSLHSLVRFLRAHHPEVDSFAQLRRVPHLEEWLRMLATAQPPYRENTRRMFLELVRRFFTDIRKWGWPDSPPPDLIRQDDYPPRRYPFPTRRRVPLLCGRLRTSSSNLSHDQWYLLLDRYPSIRPTALHDHVSRAAVLSLFEFLRKHFPDVDSIAKLQRSPHIEGWLQMLATREPSYQRSTRRNYIRAVGRFLEDIRQRAWPEVPPPGLIRREDVPRNPASLLAAKYRLQRVLAAQTGLSQETSWHRTLQRYLDIRSATLRPGSLSHYRATILSWIDFLRTRFPEIDSFEQLRRAPHIEQWLQLLANVQPPYENETRCAIIRRLARFFGDLREWDWPESPPPNLIRPDDFPPLKRRLPRPLSAEVDIALVQGLQKDDDIVSRGLLLARRTGLRIGELLHLELDCLIEHPNCHASLRVPLGKLRSERVIPIDPETADLIKTIRTMRGERSATIDHETGRPIELLLPNADGSIMRPFRFRSKLKAVAAAAGITERVCPHRLRHTYATELLRYGVSLPGVMMLLGHRSIKMTLRYVEVTNEDLGRDYLRAIDRVRHRYAELENVSTSAPDKSLDPLEALRALFDQLVARLQNFRFNHPDPQGRKKIQRAVERLRRAQSSLKKLLC